MKKDLEEFDQWKEEQDELNDEKFIEMYQEIKLDSKGGESGQQRMFDDLLKDA